LKRHLERIIETTDKKTMIAEFKRIILLAYGVKSDDGRRHIKTDQLREEFTQTAAYATLFMELAEDDKAAAEFILGIMPQDMTEEMTQMMNARDAQVTNLPTTTLSPPPPPKSTIVDV